MIPRLEKVYAVCADQVDNAMLLCEPPRPGVRREVLQRLRLADPVKRVAHDRLDEIERAQGDFAISLRPVPQVFAEFRMEHCIALLFGLTLFHPDRGPAAVFPAAAV